MRVHLKLEYAALVWNPYIQALTDQIEKVQRTLPLDLRAHGGFGGDSGGYVELLRPLTQNFIFMGFFWMICTKEHKGHIYFYFC